MSGKILPILLVDRESHLNVPAGRYDETVKDEILPVLKKVRGKNIVPVVSVLLCSNRTIRKLNRQWLGKRGATNVISFQSPGLSAAVKELGPVSLRQGALGKYFRGQRGVVFLGDMAISLDRARTESKRAGLDIRKWISRLACHGLMHILGYTHRNMPSFPRGPVAHL